MKYKPDPNAISALNLMKLEVANEFDANISKKEALDGTTMDNLVNRADKNSNLEEKTHVRNRNGGNPGLQYKNQKR